MAIQSLDREELLAILRCARAASERDWLMILVTFWHGLRASETCAMKAVDLKDGFLTVRRLKGSRTTTQELFAHADPLLDEKKGFQGFLANLPKTKPIFGIKKRRFEQLFAQHAKAAGIPAHKRHPHILKHSIAMQTIHSAGIENVRQHLGHKSMSSTGEYLKVSDEDAGAAIGRALK